ncbi:hypothetical protein [Hahella sp. HN01]|uniref:hypothetical protein n=1 Tax=Hahella sp. HN01 TaxID=2847262 RepID=UPI001C1EC389|nr:hypothetical protein [Hahella sp. HN01]MBU6952106.1 hypothetical protein [Hahella sp. HN01]
MKKIHNMILALLIALSILYALFQAYLNLQGVDVSDSTDTVWSLVFASLVALWVSKDPKRQYFKAPFEFHAFIFFLWPFTLPYYLVKTRGGVGVAQYLGFLGMKLLSFFGGVAIYFYYS